MFATYASRWGHALIDRQLYLPKAWANDPDRRAKAQVPEDVTFATKPAMACEMVARLLDEGTPCAFVLADAVYGSDFRFRRMLEDRGQPYVLAVRSTHSLRFFEAWNLVQTDPATMIAEVPPGSWQSLSAGEGTKGHRLYDWTRVPLNHTAGEGFSRWLLARRSPRDPEAIATSTYLTVALDDDPSAADRALDEYLAAYYPAPPAAMRAVQATYAGTPDGLLGWVRQFTDAGARHLILRFAGNHERHMDQCIDLLGALRAG